MSTESASNTNGPAETNEVGNTTNTNDAVAETTAVESRPFTWL